MIRPIWAAVGGVVLLGAAGGVGMLVAGSGGEEEVAQQVATAAAPKFRAMEVIDELEPVSRGPYTGAMGYLGFNRESQLSILIRTAICKDGWNYFHAGAGIVADSDPEAEYEETLVKAEGFLRAVSPAHERTAARFSPACASD